MARTPIVSVSTNEDQTVIYFDVADVGTIALDRTALPADVMSRAASHGLIQKVSDAAALGKDATPADKHAAMQAVVERLQAGDWNKRSETGEGSTPSGLIFRAYAEYANARRAAAKKKPLDESVIRASYDGMERKQQLALRGVPEIAAIMIRIKSERGNAKTSIDVDALMADLID